jgi:hypothetical protein
VPVQGASGHNSSSRATSVNYASRAFLKLWRALAGGGPKHLDSQEGILHDPLARRAQDLDDPFIDPRAQGRIGKLIGDRSKQENRDQAVD